MFNFILPDSVEESTGVYRFTITRMEELKEATTLSWKIVLRGYAPASDSNFPQTSGTVNFAKGFSGDRVVEVSLANNDRGSFDKNFTIQIIEDTPGTEHDAILASKEVTLTDNDTHAATTARTFRDNNDTASIYTIGSTEGGTYAKGTNDFTGRDDNDEYIITRYQRTNVTINDVSSGNVIKFDYGVVITGFAEGASNTITLTLSTGAVVTINEDTLATRYEYFIGEDRHANYAAFKTAIDADTITATNPFTVETAASASLTRDTYEIPTTTGDVAGTHDDDVVAVGRDANLVVDAGPGDDVYVITRFQFGDIKIADYFGKNLIKFDYGVTITDYDEFSHFLFGPQHTILTLSTGATIKINAPRASSLYAYQIGDGAVITYDEFKTEIGATGTNDTSDLPSNYEIYFPSQFIEGPDQIAYDDGHGEGFFLNNSGSGAFSVARAFTSGSSVTFSIPNATAITPSSSTQPFLDAGHTHSLAIQESSRFIGTLYFDATAVLNPMVARYEAIYEFVPIDSAIRFLASNEYRLYSYTITANKDAAEEASHDFSILIRGKNDPASFAMANFLTPFTDDTISATVTEDNGMANSDGVGIDVETTGTITFNDFDSDNTLLTLRASHTNGNSDAVTTGGSIIGEYGTIVFTVTAPVGSSNFGTIMWTYTLDNDSQEVQALGPASADTIEEFDLVVTDAEGLPSSPLNINIAIKGANDGTPPTLTGEPYTATLRDTAQNDHFEIKSFIGLREVVGTLAISQGGSPLTPASTDTNSIGGRLGFASFVEGDHGTLFFTKDGTRFTYRYVPDEEVAGSARTETFTINGTALEFTLAAGVSYRPIPQGRFEATDDGTILYQVDERAPDNSIRGYTHRVSGSEEGKYGSLYYNQTNGRWIYLANSTEIDRLNPDQEIAETFTVFATDNQGNADKTTLTVTLIGGDDPMYLHGGTEATFQEDQSTRGGGPLRYGDAHEVTTNAESDFLTIRVKVAGVGNEILIPNDTGVAAANGGSGEIDTEYGHIYFSRSNTDDGAGTLVWYYILEGVGGGYGENSIERIKVTVIDTFGYEVSEFISVNNQATVQQLSGIPGGGMLRATGDFEVYENHPLDKTTSGTLMFDGGVGITAWRYGDKSGSAANGDYIGRYGTLDINTTPTDGSYNYTYTLTATTAQLNTASGDSFDSGEVLYDAFYMRVQRDNPSEDQTWINLEFEIKGLSNLGDAFPRASNGADTLTSPNTATAGIHELIDGAGGDDTITTGRGRDVVIGGFGDDTINLGADQKTLIHRFTSDDGGWLLNDAGDTINGFKFGIDKLLLVNHGSTVVDLQGFIDNAANAPNNVEVEVIENSFGEVIGVDLIFPRALGDRGGTRNEAVLPLKIRYLEPLVVEKHDGTLNALGESLLGANRANLNNDSELTTLAPLAEYFGGTEFFDVMPVASIADVVGFS